MTSVNRGVVHIVDDEGAIRGTLTMLAEAAGHAVASHASAEAFLRAVDFDSAGCVVTDMRMPGMGGMQLLEALHETVSSLPVIVITGHGDVPTAVAAMKAGAADFIEKPFDGPSFLSAVGRALQSRSIARARLDERRDLKARHETLTTREAEVMALVVRGQSNASAGTSLGISVRTVENHRARVMAKMQAAALSDLVRMALALESN